MTGVGRLIVGSVLLLSNNTVPLPLTEQSVPLQSQETAYCFLGEILPLPEDRPYRTGDTVFVLHKGKPHIGQDGVPLFGYIPEVVVCTHFYTPPSHRS